MQTATVLTSWKPIQRNRDDATMEEIMWHCRETRQSTENTNIVLKSRHGEIPEGLSGSLAPGMLEEKRSRTWEAPSAPGSGDKGADNEARKGKPGNGARPRSKSSSAGKADDREGRRSEGR